MPWIEVEIPVEVCREGVKLPEYKHEDDAGMDVSAAEDTLIAPGQTVIIPTGLAVAIPAGYEIQVRPRSGLSVKTTLRIPNAPGTVDGGYRDEIGIIVTNTTDVGDPERYLNKIRELSTTKADDNKGVYRIKKGDRLAQIVLAPVYKIKWNPVESVKSIGSDRGGGFGHTGTN